MKRRASSQINDVPHTNSSMHIFSVTQSFPFAFSWTSDNITASNKKNRSRAYQCIWENYIIFAQDHYIIWILCQYGLLIHTCVSKNAIVYKDNILIKNKRNFSLWVNFITLLIGVSTYMTLSQSSIITACFNQHVAHKHSFKKVKGVLAV